MIDLGKQNVLGVGINAVDYNAAVHQIVAAAHARRNFTVTALAVHGVMTGAQDAEHRHRLNQFDLAVPDGQPVRWAMDWLYGVKLPERVYGPTLTLKVCERAAAEGLSVYFYGSRAEVLERLIVNLRQRFPALIVAGTHPSLFRQISTEEQTRIAQDIRNSGAAIVMVGLGCPRQEIWAYENRHLLPMPLLAVGAAFDFHAGTVAQAPAALQKRGLEWLFRLVQEPSRLWKRYLYLNPLYLSLLLLQLLKVRVVALHQNESPREQMRYG
jgi:N-acetylglucosaminyldiphosphoundecaprenol N-acetyl-beta-D-mannosaminyltransferase